MKLRRQGAVIAVVVWASLVIDRSAVAQVRGGEVVTLTTQDGVQLACTYYPAAVRPGTNESRQVTPVIMLHDLKGSRAVFTSLIQRLQAPDEGEKNQPLFAVMTVDLRAHGQSTKQFYNGADVTLDVTKLGKNDLLAMTAYDMEAVRSYLVGKNDAGELNLNKLAIVGSGMGASVAANWALTDWAAPPLAVGKQGQDVKGIVMISPRWSYNGLSMQGPMKFRPLKENVAWLLIYGARDNKVKADAQRIIKQLERFHPETEAGGKKIRRGLAEVAAPSRLQGDKLLTQLGSSLESQIVAFLVDNVAKTPQPWTSRRDRLP
jgi:pimeloyl-ACP methyl ester carboxylesterase